MKNIKYHLINVILIIFVILLITAQLMQVWSLTDFNAIHSIIDFKHSFTDHINVQDISSPNAVDTGYYINSILNDSDVKSDHALPETEVEPIYKNKYFIGVTIGVIALIVCIWYIDVFNYPDISDASSDIGSDTSIANSISSTMVSTTIVPSEASTLVPSPIVQYFIQVLPNPRMFRYALDHINVLLPYTQDMSRYLPFIGYSIHIDLELLNYLRINAENDTLDIVAVCNQLSPNAIIRMLENQGSYDFFTSIWIPSDIYPTFDSFAEDMLETITDNLHIEID